MAGSGPEDLAATCRFMAKELREKAPELQQMMTHSSFREGRAQLMEEIAAVLEAPAVIANLRALKVLLRGVRE